MLILAVPKDFFSLVEEARALNSKVFSLPRLQILLALYDADGSPFRELKAALKMSDGALFSNLKALEKMHYVEKKTSRVETKELDIYYMAPNGRDAFDRSKKWLSKWICTDAGVEK